MIEKYREYLKYQNITLYIIYSFYFSIFLNLFLFSKSLNYILVYFIFYLILFIYLLKKYTKKISLQHILICLLNYVKILCPKAIVDLNNFCKFYNFKIISKFSNFSKSLFYSGFKKILQD